MTTLTTARRQVRADTLVVGSTRGHRLGRTVHGSVSAYCARHPRCPVTVVAASRPPRIRGEAA